MKSEVKKKKLLQKLSRLSVHDRLQKKMGEGSSEDESDESDAEMGGAQPARKKATLGGDAAMPGIKKRKQHRLKCKATRDMIKAAQKRSLKNAPNVEHMEN